ncbi:MAG: ACP S-malonyltransferase [bacterium]|nr:ACP S-malonyltransferase [bacterium]
MKSLAFLFPGQASQFVGMGKDLFDTYEVARLRFEEASEVVGVNLSKICFEGPEETLKQTFITQPAIFTHSVIVAELLEMNGIRFSATAGHSLGEYSALVAAKAFDFSTGIQLVAKRGALMQADCERTPSTMAAVVGLPVEILNEVCQEAGGIVVPANFNSPGQIVISGETDAVRRAMDLAKSRGAKIVKELQVSGAFHSPLMATAAKELSSSIDSVTIQEPICDIYPNVTGKVTRDPETIRKCLKEQVTSPVLWSDTIFAMRSNGIEQFFEVGPKNVISGIVKSIDKNLPIQTVGTVLEIEALMKQIGNFL